MSSRIQSRSQRINCDFGRRCFVFVAYKTCIFFVECFLDVFVCWFVVVSVNPLIQVTTKPTCSMVTAASRSGLRGCPIST